MLKINTPLKNINRSELACDLGILLFSSLIAQHYDDIMSLTVGPLPFPVLFLMTALYFVPVLIGNLYNNDFTADDVTLRKLVIFSMITNTAFIFFYTLYYLLIKSGFSEGLSMSLGVLTIVILIMAPMAGLMFSKKKSEIEGVSRQIIVALFTVGLFPLFIVLVNGEELFGNTGGLLQILIIPGLMLADVVLIIMLLMGIIQLKKLAVRWRIYDGLMKGVGLAIPFCTAFLLTIFNIHTSRLFFEGIGRGTVLSNLLIVGAFIFTGVLPLRILLAIKPPYSAINAVLGILSVGVLLISIFIRF